MTPQWLRLPPGVVGWLRRARNFLRSLPRWLRQPLAEAGPQARLLLVALGAALGILVIAPPVAAAFLGGSPLGRALGPASIALLMVAGLAALLWWAIRRQERLDHRAGQFE